MNSLLEKEGLGGQVQMVYIDPPYGIRYGSNFQPFVNKRDVKDGADEDLTLEPETLKAFRDTWELGIHSYLSNLRDRLLLAKELLHESGSCFVQISDENIHHVRELMDEVFGATNFVSLIAYTTSGGFPSTTLSRAGDYLIWYCKDQQRIKYRQPFQPKPSPIGQEATKYDQVELKDGTRRALTREEKLAKKRLPDESRVFRVDNLISQGASEGTVSEYRYQGKKYDCGANSHWKANAPEGMDRLAAANRIVVTDKGKLGYVRYYDDFPAVRITNMWSDVGGAVQSRAEPKVFVVQTGTSVIERCLLMTTDPGDLVLDPTCGSGTTAYVAEQWGRRWITCDTSRVAITLARQRLMTAVFDYYVLRYPEHPHPAPLPEGEGVRGVGSGFIYKTVPHVTLKSIANNPEIREGMSREAIDKAIQKYAERETLYDQPEIDRSKARVTGPFTVEAVPAAAWGVPEVRGIKPSPCGRGQGEGAAEDEACRHAEDPHPDPHPEGEGVGTEIARSGETLRQSEWRAELLKTGIRAKGGAKIEFVRVEPLPGTRWLSADAETKEDKPRRAVISFGPEHAPLEQRQVAQALEEALHLVPNPKLVIFAALQFDPEAAKDIDETEWPGVTLLKVQMNGDLVTEDLKKKRSSNESFWLVGQPDVEVISEQWLVDSEGRKVVPYELGTVVSGLDSLAKINAAMPDDLLVLAIAAERGDLWADLAKCVARRCRFQQTSPRVRRGRARGSSGSFWGSRREAWRNWKRSCSYRTNWATRRAKASNLP